MNLKKTRIWGKIVLQGIHIFIICIIHFYILNIIYYYFVGMVALKRVAKPNLP